MRTARLFLGVFALALILPLLACGGSGEPADGASSERATVEPESRASSGQTTARPTTESAEPSPTHRATAAPTPAATAAPTMVQTSSETDREALIALYNATGGPNWNRKDNWLSDVPISEWDGVTTDDNGRVTALALNNNELSGEIPAWLGSLTNLKELYIPANLKELYIPANQLTWGDTGGVGQSRRTGRAVARRQPVDRGDTGGAGQPDQPEADRGDTGGAAVSPDWKRCT